MQRTAARRAAGVRVIVLAGAALFSTGCPPSRTPDGAGSSSLGAGAAGALGSLDVRRTGQQPALTLLVREGDPQPAVAVAVATSLGASASVALAAIVESRLRAAGFPVQTNVDQLGFRLTLVPARAAHMNGFVAALARAFTMPVTVDEPATRKVAGLWAALLRHPLAVPALEAVASCTGELGVLVPGPEPELPPTTAEGARQLDRWRTQALTADRSALAAVGPADLGHALAVALKQSAVWPTGSSAWQPAATEGSHGVYVEPAAAPAGARLRIGLAVHDPHRATTAAARLGEADAPFMLKLASAFPSWQLAQVGVTVTPGGGCVSLELAAQRAGALPAAARGGEAAAVARLARDEVAAIVKREPDRFLATRAIISPSNAGEAASRAAWWSLAAAGPRRDVTMTSALGVASGRGELTENERSQLEGGYREALSDVPTGPGPSRAERRIAVERGQGEVWVLVGTGCGTGGETPTEAGQAALGSLAAVEALRKTEPVQVEPWISAHGVGVIAHGAPRSATESPSSLAIRVGRAAGRAFAGGPRALEQFVHARRRLQEQLDDDAPSIGYDLALAALPAHPSRLAPLGPMVHTKDASLERVLERWRRLQRSPVRVAVLGNTDAAQAAVAASEVERWLLPARLARACDDDATSRAAVGKGGLYEASRSAGANARIVAAVVVARPEAIDRQLAELTAAMLGGEGGLLASISSTDGLRESSAHWIDWTDGLALMVELDVAPARLEEVDRRLLGLLEALRANGPTSAQMQRAMALSAAGRASTRADPRVRLEALWSGIGAAAPGAPVERGRWARWLADLLRSERIVRVRTQTVPSPPSAK